MAGKKPHFVATRSAAKKKSFRGNLFRGVKKNRFVDTRFVAKKKNSFRGNSFRGGKNKLVSWQLVWRQKKKTRFVVKPRHEFSYEIIMLTDQLTEQAPTLQLAT